MKQTPEMLFSLLSGYNIYVMNNNGTTGISHMSSGEDVDMRIVKEKSTQENVRYSVWKREQKEKWSYIVTHPVDVRQFMWPVDLVQFSESENALVFRKRALPPMTPLKTLMYTPSQLDWKDESIQKIITSLLHAFADLHANGYAYHAFDMEKIRFNPKDGTVFFDFTLSVTHYEDAMAGAMSVAKNDVKSEFLPPWVSFSERDRFAKEDDYYSIAAMLFRLMTGRMPYQGKLMDSVGHMMDSMRDTDAEAHERMFALYHEHPVFIFDEKDTSNAIGDFSSEISIKEKWERLPEKIRTMFRNVFSEDNITASYGSKKLYSPQEWLEALQASQVI